MDKLKNYAPQHKNPPGNLMKNVSFFVILYSTTVYTVLYAETHNF
jgi:hypothetical protein